MITPKEKARELIAKFAYQIREKEDEDGFIANINTTKQCALIAVDEILKRNQPVQGHFWDWWEQVKEEIEAL
jgi:hypothetical protein